MTQLFREIRLGYYAWKITNSSKSRTCSTVLTLQLTEKIKYDSLYDPDMSIIQISVWPGRPTQEEKKPLPR
jgi:hypothetical protein